MNCNYKVKLDDIQNKYKFNIFCTGSYNDSDLRKMIESVFYALPRTTASGTSVTLNDTARSYMHNELNATDTSQYSTTGKNLLNKTNYVTDSDGRIGIDVSNLVIGQTYTFSSNIAIDTFKISTASTGYSSVLETQTSGFTIFTFTMARDSHIPEGTPQYLFIKTDSSTWITSTSQLSSYNLQLESGSTATDYEPYTNGASPNPDYPQVIHTITGDNTIKVENKNLCYDKQVYNSTNLWLFAKSDFLEKTFTISFTSNISLNSNSLYLKVDRADKGLITTLTTDANNKVVKTITLTDAQYNEVKAGKEVILQVYKSGATFTIPNDAMIINGSTTEEFTPYQSNSVLLTLGDKEICKIENYEDKIFKAIKGNEIYDSLASEEKATLDYGKWYLRKAIGKVVLDGSETWYLWNIGNTNTQRFYTRLETAQTDGSPLDNGLAFLNNFAFIQGAGNTDIEHYRGSTTNNIAELIIFINRSRLNSVDVTGMRTWVANNNITAYFPLKAPVNELFNDTIQDQLEDIYNNMLSYEGQTNVSQVNEDLPFNINSTALKDLNNL